MKLQTGAIRIAEIFETAWRLVEKVAGDPPRRIETGLCLAVGTLVCLLVATLAARALRAGKVSKIRALLVTVVVVVTALVGWACFSVYVSPLMAGPTMAGWLPLVGMGLALLFIAVPLTRLVFGMNYLTALVCVVLTVAAAAGSASLTGGALRSIRVGTGQFLRSRQGVDRSNVFPATQKVQTKTPGNVLLSHGRMPQYHRR